VNLALLPISEEIECDLNNLQWLLSGYVLTWSAVVVPAGRLADLYGRKNVLISGLIIFMIGSVLTGAGHHIAFLIEGRILQGIGATVFTAPGMTSYFYICPPSQQGLARGIIS
jgi:MFS family permease